MGANYIHTHKNFIILMVNFCDIYMLSAIKIEIETGAETETSCVKSHTDQNNKNTFKTT